MTDMIVTQFRLPITEVETMNEILQQVSKHGAACGGIVELQTVKAMLDSLYDEFMTCEGGDLSFTIDGETRITDTGYAMDGIEFYRDVLKARIDKRISAITDENTQCSPEKKGDNENG